MTPISQKAAEKIRRGVLDSLVKDPENFAKEFLNAARRLKSKRGRWLKAKKRHLARKSHKRVPK